VSSRRGSSAEQVGGEGSANHANSPLRWVSSRRAAATGGEKGSANHAVTWVGELSEGSGTRETEVGEGAVRTTLTVPQVGGELSEGQQRRANGRRAVRTTLTVQVGELSEGGAAAQQNGEGSANR
jgi:hypothetical protein